MRWGVHNVHPSLERETNHAYDSRLPEQSQKLLEPKPDQSFSDVFTKICVHIYLQSDT